MIPLAVWTVRENREVLSVDSRNPAAGTKLRLGRTPLSSGACECVAMGTALEKRGNREPGETQ